MDIQSIPDTRYTKDTRDTGARTVKTMSNYYKTCPICGSNLDPGEHCDCERKGSEDQDAHDGSGKRSAAFIPQKVVRRKQRKAA